jgi:hypothetical protein
MHDLAGFILLMIGMLILLYLLVQFVLPFLVVWCLGLVINVMVMLAVMRWGRQHPVHLDRMLKPGIALVLGVIAVAVPLTHVALVYVTSASDYWLYILVLNIVPSIALAGRWLLVHRHQAAVYLRDGHFIEDLADQARSHAAAIDLDIDFLGMVSALQRDLEHWERAAGVPEDEPEVKKAELDELERVLSGLRSEYLEVQQELQQILLEVRSGAVIASAGIIERSRNRIEVLESRFQTASTKAKAFFSQLHPGMPSWKSSDAV